MINVVGILGWVFVLLFLGWLAGLSNVQLVDNRNYRRGQKDDAEREAKLAEGRANQARAEAKSLAEVSP